MWCGRCVVWCDAVVWGVVWWDVFIFLCCGGVVWGRVWCGVFIISTLFTLKHPSSTLLKPPPNLPFPPEEAPGSQWGAPFPPLSTPGIFPMQPFPPLQPLPPRKRKETDRLEPPTLIVSPTWIPLFYLDCFFLSSFFLVSTM